MTGESELLRRVNASGNLELSSPFLFVVKWKTAL